MVRPGACAVPDGGPSEPFGLGRVWAVTEPIHQPAGEPPVRREPRVQREVTSFVRRSTRMRPVHLRAWERLRHAYVLEVPQRSTSTSIAPGHPLDVAAAFGRTAPLVVEIGPGTGESLVAMAAARPEIDVLAFEVYLPGVARAVNRLHETGVTNVRLLQSDAVDGLTHLLGPGSVEELWTFFPDPWPKVRHHKRRLVDRAFADLVVSRLRPGGAWRLATDWADYAAQMRAVLDAQPDLVNAGTADDGWAVRYADRPLTRFEQRGIEAGPDRSRPALPAPMNGADRCRDRRRRTRPRTTRIWSGGASTSATTEPTSPAGRPSGSGARCRATSSSGWDACSSLPEPPRLVCAGRTDAGVHARGQVVHVDLPPAALTDPAALLRRLRRALPADLAVTAIRRAPAGFDARFGAIWRRYCYRISDANTVPDPLRRRDTTSIPTCLLDVERLNDAARTLLGLRDFGAFCKRREGATTVRTLLELTGARGPEDGSRSRCARTPSATRWCGAWSAVWSRSAPDAGRSTG